MRNMNLLRNVFALVGSSNEFNNFKKPTSTTAVDQLFS